MTSGIVEFAESKGDELSRMDEFGQWTWSEVNQRTNQLVHALRSLQIGTGDVIALLGGNRHEWMEVVNACQVNGHVVVPVNWHFSADEVAYVIENSGARALIADADFAETATAAAEQSGVEHRVMYGGSATGFADYEDLLAAAPVTEPDDQLSGSIMFYTSGTTGRPKGVKSSAFPIGLDPAVARFALDGFAALLGFPENGRVLLNAPIYHAGPLVFCGFPHMLGSSIVMRRKWDAAETLSLIDEHRITTAYAVPTHFSRLLKLPEEQRSAFDGSSLGAVWHTAAPCPPDVKRRMIDWWGPVINELYGASESGGAGCTISSEEWLERPGSVGRPLATTELYIIGDDGERLGPGEVGQIYVKNLMGSDFEYLGDEQKTADAHLEPGVFTFGDVGYVDEDGYLFLSDRKIDMIISGGVNIYPAEIESVLITHPAVADVGIFGVPNDDFGEEVKAAVELADGYEAGEQVEAELRAFCRDKLAGYKVPRSFDFGPLPRTATGKLLKRQLRAPYWEATGRAI